MDTINIDSPKGAKKIQKKSMECPFCRMIIIPSYLFATNTLNSYINVFTECTNNQCARTYITQFQYDPHIACFRFECILPTSEPKHESFSDIINEISPNFVEIYNQAYCAEQMLLNQICGVGYRKALEFLIKDYLLSIKPENEHENIKNKFLNNCIREDVIDEKIKSVAARAVWLGNDETHYIKKWQDKDVLSLKAVIKLTMHWIESEIQTKRLLEEMPQFK